MYQSALELLFWEHGDGSSDHIALVFSKPESRCFFRLSSLSSFFCVFLSSLSLSSPNSSPSPPLTPRPPLSLPLPLVAPVHPTRCVSTRIESDTHSNYYTNG